MALKSFDKYYQIAFIVFLSLMCLYLLHIGVLPFVNPDTTQYVNASASRSPGYPAFLHVDMMLLGKHNFYLTFLLQLSAGIAASIFAGKTLRSLLSVPVWMGYFFSVIFLIPYFFGDYKFANRLLSEGICYPLYLFGFPLLLKSLVCKKIKYFYGFLVSLFLMILTRPQMMFLYPIAFIAWLYICIYFNDSKKSKILLVATLMLATIGANLSDRTYHYFKHGYFSGEPVLGTSLAVSSLFLATRSDVKLIHGAKNKALFLEIYNKVLATNANIKTNATARSGNVYYHFMGSYNPIMWDSLYLTFKDQGITNWYEINKRSFAIALPLLKAHWKQYLQLYFFAVRQKFGGYYWLLFYLLLVVGSFVLHLKNRDTMTLLIFFIISSAFANYMSVALLELILRRYSAYTESFQFCLMLAIVYLVTQLKLHYDQSK